MQVGSLVMYIHNDIYYDMITPDKNEIYTVRDILKCHNPQINKVIIGIRLEEIINDNVSCIIGKTNGELAYVAEHFVEVQPPMDVEIAELLKEPVKELEEEYA